MTKTLIKLIVIGFILTAARTSVQADEFRLEPGFKLFFNGKDLTGWTLKKDGSSLDGKPATPNKRFQVIGGKLVVDAKARGNVIIESKQKFSNNVHLKFDFLAGEGCNNDLYFRGLKFDIKKGGVKNLKIGEWQHFEIIVDGKKVEFRCDGEVQRTQDAKSDSSVLGIRAEFKPIQFRHLRFKQLP